jgi:hypothetical protein
VRCHCDQIDLYREIRRLRSLVRAAKAKKRRPVK